MKPEPMPVLKGKCAKEFVKRVEKPLSPEKVEIFKEADEVFKAIKPVK
jgi:hypothetical protein